MHRAGEMLDMVPTDPDVVEGSLLTFNCTLRSNASTWSNSSDMHFTYHKREERKKHRLPGKYYTIVNSSTLMLQYPNVSRSFHLAQFACFTKNDTFVDQMEITVDSKCSRLTSLNFTIAQRTLVINCLFINNAIKQYCYRTKSVS